MLHSTRAVLHAIESGHLALLNGPCLIVGAHGIDLMPHFAQTDFTSPFAGDKCPPRQYNDYQTIILFAQQQKDGILFDVATCLGLLRASGQFILVAANDAGGKSLGDIVAKLGYTSTSYAKHKCRVLWFTKSQPPEADSLTKALHKGGVQQRNDGLWTQPGVFSWDRTDAGTAILLPHIPHNITGDVADIAAGIGEIGLTVWRNNPTINSLTSLEHDRRALDCTILNLKALGDRHQPIWGDIHNFDKVGCFDAVVMNPPFHDGKETSFSLGETCVTKAVSALKKSGRLWMVANTHLPYEPIISKFFRNWSILEKKNGFKVIHAVK